MGITRKLAAVAAVAAGVAVIVPSTAYAADGGGRVVGYSADGCGTAAGNYAWFQTGHAAGKPLYTAAWDLAVRDDCKKDGKGVGVYTKYWKYKDGRWVDYTRSYHRVKLLQSGNDVRDVRLFVCTIGKPSSCGKIS
jgi:hypothetical protein